MKTSVTLPRRINFLSHAIALGLAVGLGSLAWTGCQKKPRVVAGYDISGRYTLVSVDGAAVPTTISHDGAKLLIRAGRFTIDPDGTCHSEMTFVPPSGQEAHREVDATYTREGGRLEMKWKGAGRTVGTVESNTFTMNNEGMVLAYRKD